MPKSVEREALLLDILDLAFISVEHIMRDVNYGWLLRYMHANGASFFFIFVYLHIGRGLYYGSYRAPRTLVWSIGPNMSINGHYYGIFSSVI
ncbi:hypothetical protein E3Q13_04487 [Wallemia mellicola]|nr:hypothetical protein E3Q13_04487 [Wallemia mellicola]